jgi:cytochrome c556
MPRKNHTATIIASGLALLLIGAFNAPASAQDSTAAKPMELRRIMQGLGKNMQLITDGISREDWASVATLAAQLAEHPQMPTGEKLRILAFAGADAPKFKALDDKTHHAAHGLAEAAARKDGKQVITAFAQVQSTCLACHQGFRKPFVAHFYGAQGETGR